MISTVSEFSRKTRDIFGNIFLYFLEDHRNYFLSTAKKSLTMLQWQTSKKTENAEFMNIYEIQSDQNDGDKIFEY